MADYIAPLYPWMHLVGRILLALVFVVSGVGHLTRVAATGAYAQSKGIPAPKVAAVVSGIVIIVCGLLVALGWHRFIAAGLLFLFLLATAFLMHNFWTVTDPMARMGERTQFLKDLALAGAALLIAYYAGMWWPMSLGH
jgi:putative oxidoreductase